MAISKLQGRKWISIADHTTKIVIYSFFIYFGEIIENLLYMLFVITSQRLGSVMVKSAKFGEKREK